MATQSAQVPGVLKGVQGILITLVVGIGGYLIYRNYKKNQEVTQANTQGAQAGNELAVLAQQGIVPSYTDSEFEGFSQQLVQAMNGCGSDTDQIHQVFQAMQSKADILKLINIFGVRYIEPCWITQVDAYAIWLVDDQHYGGGISTWLSFKLSASEIGKINAILTGKGIDYSF